MLGVGCPDRHALPHITRSKHIDPDSCSLPRERVRSSEPKAAARPWRVEPPTQQTPAGKQEAGDPAALHMFAVAVILAVSAGPSPGDLTDWLSSIAADGLASRSIRSRTAMCNSAEIVSQTPSRSKSAEDVVRRPARRKLVARQVAPGAAARRISPHPSLRPFRQRQPGEQHCIGPPAPRCTRPVAAQRGQRRHRKSSLKAASGTLVLAAAGVWSSSRPSNPAASLGCGLSHRSGSTAHDHHTAVAIPLSPLPSDAAISPATATLRRQRPPAPPSAGKTRSIEYQITAPIASAVAKTGTAPLAQPSPYPEPSNQIKQRRQIPHRPTPASARTPPRFPPSRLFGRLPPCSPSAR